MASKKILLIAPEFLTWDLAKHLSYNCSVALEDGLRSFGIDVVTVPPVTPHSSFEIRSHQPVGWLRYAPQLLEGERFDQVWIELCHNHLPFPTLEWLASLAPVRLGFVWESLRYSEADVQANPFLRYRESLVSQRFPFMTHLCVADQRDAIRLKQEGEIPVTWWPGSAPRWAFDFSVEPPDVQAGIFSGAVYGERKRYLEHQGLAPLLQKLTPAEHDTQLPALFDTRNALVSRELEEGRASRELLEHHVARLRDSRRLAYELWLQSLARGTAVVNLPMITGGCFASRVFDALAIGRPVIAHHRAAVEGAPSPLIHEQEIMLFSSPDELTAQLQRVLHDKEFAQQLAERGRKAARERHCLEQHLEALVDWTSGGPEHPNLVAPALRQVAEGPSDAEERYYVDLFTKNPEWSSSTPNWHELPRWRVIERFLKQAVRACSGSGPRQKLRILDVGCGRGWIVNLASAYGSCEGVEPVRGVVEYARKTFPHLTFHAGTLGDLLQQPGFEPFDVIISSEVIEHVPDGEKPKFSDEIRRALKPGGFAIITTPRLEALPRWRTMCDPDQPIEDWMDEASVRGLFEGCGFSVAAREHLFTKLPDVTYVESPSPEQIAGENLLALYQLWMFESPLAMDAEPAPTPSFQPPQGAQISSFVPPPVDGAPTKVIELEQAPPQPGDEQLWKAVQLLEGGDAQGALSCLDAALSVDPLNMRIRELRSKLQSAIGR